MMLVCVCVCVLVSCILVIELNLVGQFVPFRALASRDAKKKHVLHFQTLFYLFYKLILQLTLHLSFYFYIQLNKIILASEHTLKHMLRGSSFFG